MFRNRILRTLSFKGQHGMNCRLFTKRGIRKIIVKRSKKASRNT